jgi:Transglycosylase SLT domain
MLFSWTCWLRLAVCLSIAGLMLAPARSARSGPASGEWQTAAAQRAPSGPATRFLPNPPPPDRLCDAAVHAAEIRHRLPYGLLFAISQVESGRPDPALRRLEPWPWTVQAEGRGIYFESKAQAVQWVTEARARGITSIDTGCMQVNLFYHPRAFATTGDAFDPDHNADYAARFLLQLHALTGDWQQATGFYHSQTLALATSYRERIGRALSGETPGARSLVWPAAPKPPTTLDHLADAWRATLGVRDPAPPNPADPGAHDWSVLLRAPTRIAQERSPTVWTQRPRRYAAQSFLLPSLGRAQ